MSSIKVSSIALVAALTPLLTLAPESVGASNLAPQVQKVVCTDKEALKKVTASAPGSKDAEASQTVTVSVPDSTVNFVCPSAYTFDPAVTGEAEKQDVYSDASCEEKELLTYYCPKATLEAGKAAKPDKEAATSKAVENEKEEVNEPAATLRVPELPVNKTAVFYVQCKPPQDNKPGEGRTATGQTAQAQAPCVVQVTVKQAPNKDETGGPGEAGGVHVCKQPSITVHVPDEDSSVHFSCERQFRLYPTDSARVFKDDCKTEEPLKDMKRTGPATAPPAAPDGVRSPLLDDESPPVYTLKAVKKPPKKKLCYLCATQAPDDKTAKPPQNYCAIYVESSARARPFGLGFTPLALILSSILAMLHLP